MKIHSNAIRSNGFTLIEVLVALAIFAVAGAALSTAIQGNVRNANYLKDKTLANWIANNKMVELHQVNQYPKPMDRIDKLEFAGREWVVNTKVQKAQSKMPVRIVEISGGVEYGDETNYYATLTGLVSDTK